MIHRFWRQLPTAIIHRIFAIDLDISYTVIGRAAVTKPKMPMQINLYKSAHMGLFSLPQLAVVPPPRVLAVVDLIERIAQHLSHLCSGWIKPVQLSLNGVELGIVIEGQLALSNRDHE